MLFIFIIVPTKAKSSASETPVTISGFVSGIFVTPMVKLRSLGPIEWMPMAAAEPITVAISEEITATMTELSRSGSSTLSLNNSP